MPSHPTCSSQEPAPNRGHTPLPLCQEPFTAPLVHQPAEARRRVPLHPLLPSLPARHLLPAVTSPSCLFHVPSGDFVFLLVHSHKAHFRAGSRGANLTDPHLSMGLRLSPPHSHSHTRGPLSRPAAFSGRVLRWQYFAFPRDECSDFSFESFLTDGHSLCLQLL